MGKSNSVGKGAAVLALSNVICKALGILYKIPLANMGGGEIMAAYQIGMSVFTLGIMSFSAGIPLVCTRAIASAENEREAVALRRGALIPAVIFGGVVSVLTFLFAEPLAALAGNVKGAFAVRAVAPGIFACCVSVVLRASFQARQDFLPYGGAQIAESLLRLLAGVGLATLLLPYGASYGAAGALAGVCAGEFGGLLFLLLFTKSKTVSVKPAGCLKMVREALPLSGGALIRSFSGFAETALLLRRLPLSGLSVAETRVRFGIYSGYVMTCFSIPPTFISALCASLLASFSKKSASGNLMSLSQLARKSLLAALTLAAPFFALFFVDPGSFLAVLFSREEEVALGEKLLCALSPGVMLMAVNSVLACLLTACGDSRRVARIGIFSCGLRLCIIYFCSCVSGIGIFVLPLATLCGMIFTFLCQTVICIRKNYLKVFPLWEMSKNMLLGVASFSLMRHFVRPESSVLLSVLWIFSSFSLYFFLQLFLKNEFVCSLFGKMRRKIKIFE